MYSISILHQTTTAHLVTRNTFLLYSISILHQTTTIGGIERPTISCILFQFYIKPQLFSRNFFRGFRCILFQFYIKPQPRRSGTATARRCILFQFYIKPQQLLLRATPPPRCILFQFYIKPQLYDAHIVLNLVVFYFNSTSNHNEEIRGEFLTVLYSISILHQTTT